MSTLSVPSIVSHSWKNLEIWKGGQKVTRSWHTHSRIKSVSLTSEPGITFTNLMITRCIQILSREKISGDKNKHVENRTFPANYVH